MRLIRLKDIGDMASFGGGRGGSSAYIFVGPGFFVFFERAGVSLCLQHGVQCYICDLRRLARIILIFAGCP
jgi:hypothetical protein